MAKVTTTTEMKAGKLFKYFDGAPSERAHIERKLNLAYARFLNAEYSPDKQSAHKTRPTTSRAPQAVYLIIYLKLDTFQMSGKLHMILPSIKDQDLKETSQILSYFNLTNIVKNLWIRHAWQTA